MQTAAKRLFSQFKKLRIQLFFAYLAAFAIFLVAVFSVMFYVVQNMIITQIGTSRLDVLKQISERANTIKASSITISNLYRYDARLRGLLESGARQDQEAYLLEMKRRYDEVFQDVGISYEAVILGDGIIYSSQGNDYNTGLLSQQLWYRRLLAELAVEQTGGVQFVRTFKNDFGLDDGGYAFGAGSQLYSGETFPVLLLLIDEMRLNELYDSVLSEGSSIYIYDKDGFIVSHPDKKMLGKQFINVANMQALYGVNSFSIIKKLGKDYLFSTYHDPRTGWTMAEEIPRDNIFGVLYSAYRLLAFTLTGCMLLALAVSYYMSRRLSDPLAQLSEAMDRFGNVDFTRLPANSGTQEIDHLRESFNHMAGEIITLMDDIRTRSRQKRILEISFLRAQINPHFLYNTLFSIRCLVEIGKNEQATKMLSAFTDLLRMTLSVENAAITLEEEFESTQKYLVLQKIRYGEKISFALDLADETKNCYVLPLILQPVVENAIFHGLEAKRTPGTIVVSSALERGALVVTVSDDGVGMAKDELEKLRLECLQPPRGKQRSIGLANVHSRITLNGGEGVTVDSTEGVGTTVTLHMAVWDTPHQSEVTVS